MNDSTTVDQENLIPLEPQEGTDWYLPKCLPEGCAARSLPTGFCPWLWMAAWGITAPHWGYAGTTWGRKQKVPQLSLEADATKPGEPSWHRMVRAAVAKISVGRDDMMQRASIISYSSSYLILNHKINHIFLLNELSPRRKYFVF